MKLCALIFAASLCSCPAFAARTLLDCNLPGGDLQQFTVLKEGERLFVRELDRYGTLRERPLAAEEWESEELKVTSRFGHATLTKSKNGWYFLHEEPGYSAQGFADCRMGYDN